MGGALEAGRSRSTPSMTHSTPPPRLVPVSLPCTSLLPRLSRCTSLLPRLPRCTLLLPRLSLHPPFIHCCSCRCCCCRCRRHAVLPPLHHLHHLQVPGQPAMYLRPTPHAGQPATYLTMLASHLAPPSGHPPDPPPPCTCPFRSSTGPPPPLLYLPPQVPGRPIPSRWTPEALDSAVESANQLYRRNGITPYPPRHTLFS